LQLLSFCLQLESMECEFDVIYSDI